MGVRKNIPIRQRDLDAIRDTTTKMIQMKQMIAIEMVDMVQMVDLIIILAATIHTVRKYHIEEIAGVLAMSIRPTGDATGKITDPSEGMQKQTEILETVPVSIRRILKLRKHGL
jgi:hypothetical protein